jgi:hypothetical protein
MYDWNVLNFLMMAQCLDLNARDLYSIPHLNRAIMCSISNSGLFKSVEEKVGDAYTSVKVGINFH